ncbi:hypothetical protein JOE61_000911 [Nocardioides salarius]|uniref:Uncharacterized protein n=1 Tax=Nocardioides salarius TaxID=374513 RepID=A0ABS2M7C7_9ACTN|nr:hypothetical protein [Nocardioides salarius]MBM7507097.1 hypothetical protein [Nocardioides salarius]
MRTLTNRSPWRVAFLGLAATLSSSLVGVAGGLSPASADESFYGVVEAPPRDYPLLKGCWYYSFDWRVHMPDSAGGMFLSGRADMTDDAGHVVGDPLYIDGLSEGTHESRVCSSSAALGSYTWAGGSLQFFCTSNCPSGQDNASEHGSFVGEDVEFIRALSAVSAGLTTRQPRAGRVFRVDTNVLQGTADFAAPYPKAPVQLQLRSKKGWRDLKSLNRRTNGGGAAAFKLTADRGRYLLRAVVDDDGMELPESSVSVPFEVRVR